MILNKKIHGYGIEIDIDDMCRDMSVFGAYIKIEKITSVYEVLLCVHIYKLGILIGKFYEDDAKEES